MSQQRSKYPTASCSRVFAARCCILSSEDHLSLCGKHHLSLSGMRTERPRSHATEPASQRSRARARAGARAGAGARKRARARAKAKARVRVRSGAGARESEGAGAGGSEVESTYASEGGRQSWAGLWNIYICIYIYIYE